MAQGSSTGWTSGIEAYASLSSNSNAKASATTIALSRNYKDRVSVFKIKAYVMFSEEPLYIFGLHGLWPMLRPSDRGCSAFISRRHPAASLQAHRRRMKWRARKICWCLQWELRAKGALPHPLPRHPPRRDAGRPTSNRAEYQASQTNWLAAAI